MVDAQICIARQSALSAGECAALFRRALVEYPNFRHAEKQTADGMNRAVSALIECFGREAVCTYTQFQFRFAKSADSGLSVSVSSGNPAPSTTLPLDDW